MSIHSKQTGQDCLIAHPARSQRANDAHQRTVLLPVRNPAARQRLQGPHLAPRNQVLIEQAQIGPVVLDLQRRPAEGPPGEREIARMVVNLDCAVSNPPSRKVCRQLTARPNLQTAPRWRNLHVGIEKALDRSTRPFLNRTGGLKAVIQVNSDQVLTLDEYEPDRSEERRVGKECRSQKS